MRLGLGRCSHSFGSPSHLGVASALIECVRVVLALAITEPRLAPNGHHLMSTSMLPPELWLIVFDLATFVPNAFDAEVHNPFDYPRRLGVGDDTFMIDMRGDLRAIRRASRTKRAIFRVCKTWHALVTPLLYEAVSLVRESNIPALA